MERDYNQENLVVYLLQTPFLQAPKQQHKLTLEIGHFPHEMA